jgi:hypothetical protein
MAEYAWVGWAIAVAALLFNIIKDNRERAKTEGQYATKDYVDKNTREVLQAVKELRTECFNTFPTNESVRLQLNHLTKKTDEMCADIKEVTQSVNTMSGQIEYIARTMKEQTRG